jgi:macrolide transport system ATP-binding/permease protein
MTLLQDVRYALRQLLKTPAFTATVLLTLALGIGANVAIFTVMDAVLLRNLPVTDPKTIIRVGDENDCCVGSGIRSDAKASLFSTEVYQQIRKNVPEFEDVAAMQAGFSYRPIIARRDGAQQQARSVMGEFVSGNYFRVFGLQPAAGRLLMDSDDTPGAPMVAIMSYATWHREQAGNPAVVGSTFWINTQAVTIVGVAPDGFYGDRLSSAPPDFYLPIETMPALANVAYVHEPMVNWLYIMGRVKPGQAIAPLQEEVSALVRRVTEANSTAMSAGSKKLISKMHVVLSPGGAGIQFMQEEYSSHLHLLMWIAALVLFIACANIANLLLVRGMARRSEMCIRMALGANRSRIARQLLTESVVLAGLGGILAMFLAYAGTRALLLLAFPGTISMPVRATPSLTVFAFSCGLSAVTGILFGLAPAWIAAQTQPAEVLRSGARTTGTGASLLQRGLVVLQAALSLILLVGAGLFAQSLANLQNTDMKLDPTNRYIAHINPQAAGYLQTQVEPLYRIIGERFHAIPGVVNVGLATYTPMEDDNWGSSVQVEGQPNLNLGASFVKVNSEYFDSVGTKVVMGRNFTVQDNSTARTVAIVNEAFVKAYLKDLYPIGQHFGSPGPGSQLDYQIVGVVQDTAYSTVRWKNHRMYFVPMMQRAASDKSPITTDESLYPGAMVIQTNHPVPDMERLARDTLASINPNMSLVKFQTFSEQIADRFTDERVVARLTFLFGGLALLLATIGLYGVTAFTVGRRTSEIGIRMALGAERWSVVTMVMRGALIQAAIGLAIGIPVAIASVRFVKTQLYEITSANATVMFGGIVTLAVAACIAGLIPARRAASIDPVKALRSE